MATYNRRGYKKSAPVKSTEDNVNVQDEQSTTAEVFNTLDETASKSEKWIEKNSKPLFIGFIAAVAIIFGFYGYSKFVADPNEKEAANALVYAQKDFTTAENSKVDSLYNIALEGKEGQYGLLDVADEYSGTKAGNLAKYYAGIAYLKINDANKAIEFLSDVSVEDDVLNAVIKGAQGDAYLSLNNPEKALDLYEAASEQTTNEAITPVYLMKAGNVALSLNENKKAAEFFTTIKEDFSTSPQSQNIEKYINLAKYNK